MATVSRPVGAREGNVVELLWLAATAVGKFLVPLFSKGKDQLGDELAKTAGDAAAAGLVKTSEGIWSAVKSQFSGEDEKKTLDLFQKNPEAMDKMLVSLLQERLAEDPAFCKQIQELIDAPVGGNGQTSWQVMDHSGVVDARYATISGGTVAGLIINADPAQQPSVPPVVNSPPAGDAGPR